MCGRFINTTKIKYISKIFDLNYNSKNINDVISYNIAPSQNVNIVLINKSLSIQQVIWGINFFDKKSNTYNRVINSRLETIKDKILFKKSFFNKRCLIPTNGFFEWSNIEGIKNPYFFQVGNLETFYFPGIWKYSIINNIKIKTFSIITKSANQNIHKIHNRMPVIMNIEEGRNYLENNDFLLESNFISDFEEILDYFKVSKFVNSPNNNSLECIKSVN